LSTEIELNTHGQTGHSTQSSCIFSSSHDKAGYRVRTLMAGGEIIKTRASARSLFSLHVVCFRCLRPHPAALI